MANVFLYNPISGTGHFDSWNAMFAAVIARQGHQLVCFTPDVNVLRNALIRQGVSDEHIIFQKVTNPTNVSKKILYRIVLLAEWWRIFSHRYIENLPDAQSTANIPFLRKVEKQFYRITVPLAAIFVPETVLTLVNLLWKKYGEHKFSFFCIEVNNFKQKFSIEPDLVYHMYPHYYSQGEFDTSTFSKLCHFKWAALIVPHYNNLDVRYFNDCFSGACFLVESLYDELKQKFAEKEFCMLPDIVEDALSKSYDISKFSEIKSGKSLVLLCGALDKRKNIRLFCELIRRLDPEKWCFAIVGKIFRTNFEERDHSIFDIVENCPSNVIVHADFINDETEFNAIIKASDILFAAYRDFEGSSNLLGKAAAFEKPILVSSGYVMEHRVRQYGIGIAIQQDDVEQAIAALEKLKSNRVDPSCFAAYRNDHSKKQLTETLSAFIANCLKH